MGKINVWKILTLFTFVLSVGCATTTPNSSTGASSSEIYGTGDASSGAGTGTGGTQTKSSGTGDASSGAGTGTGGTTK